MNRYQRRRIILLDRSRSAIIAKSILHESLDLVTKLVEALFNNNPYHGLLRYVYQLDNITKYAAGVTRAELLNSNYTYAIAKYYVHNFAFQHFFQNSYRVRKSIVLRRFVEAILYEMNLNVIRGLKYKDDVIKRIYKMNLPKNVMLPYVDVLALNINGTVFMFQIRATDALSRTAMASLVDLLTYILKYGNRMKDTRYTIVIWRATRNAQAYYLIFNIWNRLSSFTGQSLSLGYLKENIWNGVRIPNTNIILRLVYGINGLTNALISYTGNASIIKTISNIWDALINWDDLWLTYAIASLELQNIITKNISNPLLLEKYMKKAGIILHRCHLYNYDYSSRMFAQRIVPYWNTNTLPVWTPSDIINYIRDLILLKMIHYGLQNKLI